MIRPSDSDVIKMLDAICKTSSCKRTQVGVLVLAKEGYSVASVNGHPSCNELGCLRAEVKPGESLESCRGAHAEIRAILNTAANNHTKGATVYSSHSPCASCARALIEAGVSEIVYITPYTNTDIPFQLLKEAGIKVRQIRREEDGTSREDK